MTITLIIVKGRETLPRSQPVALTDRATLSTTKEDNDDDGVDASKGLDYCFGRGGPVLTGIFGFIVSSDIHRESNDHRDLKS